MSTFRFSQVNVFSADPLSGNPLAVVHAAEGLDDARMAALARWTHLSETTFLLPPTDPDADYRVRIFTPVGELHSRVTRRSVPAVPGWLRVESRAQPVSCRSNAAWASSGFALTVRGSNSPRRRCIAPAPWNLTC
jgi:hypothetical protein